jgi:hypothetical protein
VKWGSAGQLAAAPGRRARAAPLPPKQGRTSGVGDMGEGTRVPDARDRGEAGPSVSSGVRERVNRREAGRWWGTDT